MTESQAAAGVPTPLPVRVLVKGSSNVLLTSYMNGDRTANMPFPRVIERELRARGRLAEVHNGGVLAMPVHHMLKTWGEEVVAWSPDVVVLAVGQHDVLHSILPRWLERGGNAENRRATFWQQLYYRKFLRATARGVLHVQKRYDRPSLRLKRRTRKVLKDLEQYIKIVSFVGTPLIVLLEVHPPASNKVPWYRGWADRIAALNDGYRELAAQRENVVFVEISDLTEQFDPGTPDHLWADGIHFNTDFHYAVGSRLADVIEEWSRTQAHLAQP